MSAVLFPGVVDVVDRVAAAWIIDDSPLPVPRFELRCPVCTGSTVLAKDWRYHERTGTGSARPWRCDVRFKCCDCSHVWHHGVALTLGQWMERPRGAGRLISWRRAFELLKAAGIVDDEGRVRT